MGGEVLDTEIQNEIIENDDSETSTNDKMEFDYAKVIKMLLGDNFKIEDEILLVYIDITKQSILNYCNIDTLPPSLNYTLCNMVCELIIEKSKSSKYGQIVGNVSSVSEDGRTVSFSTGVEFKTSMEDKISKTKELNRYRELYRL